MQELYDRFWLYSCANILPFRIYRVCALFAMLGPAVALASAEGPLPERSAPFSGQAIAIQVGQTSLAFPPDSSITGSKSGTLLPATQLVTSSQSVDAASGHPSSASAPLALPRVPWEGGPAYYEKFPQAKARRWTDAAFFPIAVWGATVENRRDVEVDKEIGINTYLGIFAASGVKCAIDFEAIRAGGMSAIHEHRDCKNVGDETVGWLLADEPEQFGQRPGQVAAYLRKTEEQFPRDGRMRYTNFTGNMLWPAYASSQIETAEWHDINDVTSLDAYWHGRDLPCHGREYQKDFPADNLSALTDKECHRPFNYGYQVDKQIELARFGANHKWEPVFTFVENGSPFADDVWAGGHVHTITPDQMAASVWNSLIHEARGVNYFNHSFSGDCQNNNNLRSPIYTKSTCYVTMRAKAKEVNGQIRSLAPVLNTQSFQWKFDPNLDTMLKYYDGSYYIFAMPTGIKGPAGSAYGTHSLQLPPGLSGSKAEVLFESRNIPISPDRQFKDDFATENTYHIYKISPENFGAEWQQ